LNSAPHAGHLTFAPFAGPDAAQAESETTKKIADRRIRSFFMMRLLLMFETAG
jgi:hypothetical protein